MAMATKLTSNQTLLVGGNDKTAKDADFIVAISGRLKLSFLDGQNNHA
jgi:hypothetical protein